MNKIVQITLLYEVPKSFSEKFYKLVNNLDSDNLKEFIKTSEGDNIETITNVENGIIERLITEIKKISINDEESKVIKAKEEYIVDDNERFQIAKRLYDAGVDLDIIASSTKLPSKEVKKLAN